MRPLLSLLLISAFGAFERRPTLADIRREQPRKVAPINRVPRPPYTGTSSHPERSRLRERRRANAERNFATGHWQHRVVQAAQLDVHDYLLNTLNGTVDLRDGRLYEHDPKHLITRCCQVGYHPEITSDALARVIAHVTRDDPAVVQAVPS